MKKTILLFNLLAIISLNSIAQLKSKRVDILWGPELKESRGSTLHDIVAHDETGVYALKSEAKGFSKKLNYALVHYDNSMAQTGSVELDLVMDNKSRDFEFTIHLDNKLYLFSSYPDKKAEINFLYVQEIDKNSLYPNNSLKQIVAKDVQGNRRFNSGNYSYELSNDKSKILIYFNLPNEKGEGERFGLFVFDKDINKLWERIVTVPYNGDLFNVEDFEVDNNGNVHLLGLIYNEKRRTHKRDGSPNYRYQVFSYTKDNMQVKEYPINIEGKFLTDMKIVVNDEQDIICGGFYSSKGTFSIEGSYFLKIDGKTKEIKTQDFQKFGIDFITQNMTDSEERQAKKKADKGKNVELFQYDLDNIILRTDGGAMLIGEQYFVRVVNYSSSGANGSTMSTTKYYYYYNDIIAINVSPVGKIEWTEKIPKRQITVDDRGAFSSYALSVVNDKVYFVFNDNPKNLFPSPGGKIHNFNKGKESITVLVTLDSDGRQVKEALFTSREAEVLIRPKVCEQISKTEMVLFGEKKKIHKTAKVTFLD